MLSPSRDECASFRKFDDAIIGLVALKEAVAVGNEDVTVRRGAWLCDPDQSRRSSDQTSP